MRVLVSGGMIILCERLVIQQHHLGRCVDISA
jgi:hypothetical protein